jgi:hypothetical protein
LHHLQIRHEKVVQNNGRKQTIAFLKTVVHVQHKNLAEQKFPLGYISMDKLPDSATPLE